jgi:death-on-curing protein
LPKNKRHYRVSLADALSAHDEALTFGGRPGIIDLSRVQSAIGRPYSGYHRTIQSKAAALVESMSRNHGFVDGNKRTTLLLLHMLLVKSGYRLVPLAGEDINAAVENLILGVVGRQIAIDAAVQWFEMRVKR